MTTRNKKSNNNYTNKNKMKMKFTFKTDIYCLNKMKSNIPTLMKTMNIPTMTKICMNTTMMMIMNIDKLNRFNLISSKINFKISKLWH